MWSGMSESIYLRRRQSQLTDYYLISLNVNFIPQTCFLKIVRKVSTALVHTVQSVVTCILPILFARSSQSKSEIVCSSNVKKVICIFCQKQTSKFLKHRFIEYRMNGHLRMACWTRNLRIVSAIEQAMKDVYDSRMCCLFAAFFSVWITL